jgi:hypothetical protein
MYELATLQRDLGDQPAAEATYFQLLDDVGPPAAVKKGEDAECGTRL